MRKLEITEHISLHGVIQHSADDSDLPYSDWNAPDRTPVGRDAVLAVYGGFDLLLGRRTCDLCSGFGPNAPGSPLADGINAATKYIATTFRRALNGARSRVSGRTSSQTHSALSRTTAQTLSFRAAPRLHRRCSNRP